MSTDRDKYNAWADKNRERKYADHKAWEEAHPRKMIGTRLPIEATEIIYRHLAEEAEKERRKISALPEEERCTYRRKYTAKDGRDSLNAMITALLSEEVGQDLSPKGEEYKRPGRKKRGSVI